MNEKTPPGIVRHKRFVVVVLLATLVLGLAFAAPALAAAFPPRAEMGAAQGTVPPPPPSNNQDNNNDDDNEDSFPTATPTPGAAAEGAAAGAPAADSAPSQSGAASFAGIVLSPRLNVRTGPSTTFGSVGQYLQNESLTIQFRDDTGAWWYTCCVTGTTTSGWSSASFIQAEFDPAEALTLLSVYPGLEQLSPSEAVATSATPPPPSEGSLTAVVNAQPRLIMREGPSANDAIVGRVSDGATVEVLARDETGEWWYICCADGSSIEGWANSAFLLPDFDAASANTLIPLMGASPVLPTPTPRGPSIIPKRIKLSTATPTPLTVEVPAAAATPRSTTTPRPSATPAATQAAVQPTPTLQPEEEATPSAVVPAAPAAMTSLTAMAWQEPAFAAPGDTVLLRWLISNTGADAARHVELRNELPAELALQSGAGSLDADYSSAQASDGNTIVALQWAEIPAGESVTATVAVQLAASMADGSVLRNLAAIGAENAAGLTSGLTISTPPTTLPTFQ